MAWMASVLKLAPLVAGLAEKAVDKLWPDRSDARSKAHEIELEEMRKFRLPPKTLLRYVIIWFFVLCVAWEGAFTLFPGVVPATPFTLQSMLVLADTLFGLGG